MKPAFWLIGISTLRADHDAVCELKAIQHFFVASSGPSKNGMPRKTRLPLGMLISPLSRVSRLSPLARSRGPKPAGVAEKLRDRSIGTNLSETVCSVFAAGDAGVALDFCSMKASVGTPPPVLCMKFLRDQLLLE